jgi:IclR family transcriptional regulator, KDG regulon repressor
VVGKAFYVVESLAQANSAVRLSDLARELRQPKATVYRILYTLSQLGYVRQDPTSAAYQLTDKIAHLSRDDIKESLRGAARPFMEKLLARFEQTVNLGLLDHGQILYVEIVQGIRSIRMAATANTYAPLHSTALGKAVLAFTDRAEVERMLKQKPLLAFTRHTIISTPRLISHLQQARRRGFAVDNEEMEAGARCVAAPIFNADGQAIAAMSVSGPTSHIRGAHVRNIAQAVLAATCKVSERLGFRAGERTA